MKYALLSILNLSVTWLTVLKSAADIHISRHWLPWLHQQLSFCNFLSDFDSKIFLENLTIYGSLMIITALYRGKNTECGMAKSDNLCLPLKMIVEKTLILTVFLPNNSYSSISSIDQIAWDLSSVKQKWWNNFGLLFVTLLWIYYFLNINKAF